MSKTSESSTEKSIRNQFDEMVYNVSCKEKGWKTANGWSIELGIKTETFVKRVNTLIQLGKAKKKMMLTRNHGVKAHYWIEKLSK